MHITSGITICHGYVPAEILDDAGIEKLRAFPGDRVRKRAPRREMFSGETKTRIRKRFFRETVSCFYATHSFLFFCPEEFNRKNLSVIPRRNCHDSLKQQNNGPSIYRLRPFRGLKLNHERLIALLRDTWYCGLMGHIPGEWKGVNRIDTLGGEQEMLCLSEHGLYFFLACSDKPADLPFQKHIAGEILPSMEKFIGHVATITADDESDIELTDVCTKKQEQERSHNRGFSK
jgi:hypothetical protein